MKGERTGNKVIKSSQKSLNMQAREPVSWEIKGGIEGSKKG